MCREFDALNSLVPVPALAQIINELSVACCFAENGCTAKITLGSKYSHEKDCNYRPEVCQHRLEKEKEKFLFLFLFKISSYCFKIIYCKILKNNSFILLLLSLFALFCVRALGCKFHGSRQQLESHLETCVFEQIQEYVQQTNDKIGKLEETIAKQHGEIRLLKKLVIEKKVFFGKSF